MADKVNVYFPSLAEETLPNLKSVLAQIRADRVLRDWVKLWFDHGTYDVVRERHQWLQQLRDKDFIDENVEIDGSLQYYEWRNGTVNYLEDCLKALLARHRRHGTEFAVYGIEPDKNDRLITFVDALQDPKLPDEFVKIKCMNTLDELQQYCDARISLENLIRNVGKFKKTEWIARNRHANTPIYKGVSGDYQDLYFYRDQFHIGSQEHFEVFDGNRRHVGVMYMDGRIDEEQADPCKHWPVST